MEGNQKAARGVWKAGNERGRFFKASGQGKWIECPRRGASGIWPPSVPLVQERYVMGDHYAELMKELNANNDEVVSLNAQRNDRDVVIHMRKPISVQRRQLSI
jgi:hypothetical protein